MFVNKHKFVVVHFNIKIESVMYSEGQYGESIRRRVKLLVWSAGCSATMIYYGLQINNLQKKPRQEYRHPHPALCIIWVGM